MRQILPDFERNVRIRRLVRRGLTAAGILILALPAAGFWAGNFFYELALNPNSDKTGVLNAGHNRVDYDETATERWRENLSWLDGAGYVKVRMDSRDGLELRGYLLENAAPAENWAVIFHGYNSSARVMADFARQFYDMGYSLLLPDARGCGDSGGEYIGMGWHDRLDALDWIGRLNARYSPKNVVLYGVSMGAATAVMTGGEVLPDNVRAIVSDSAYSSVMAEFTYQGRQLYGAPPFPVLNFASAVTRIRAGFWLEEADTVRQAQKSAVPILFIHGGDDAFVPPEMAKTLFDAAVCEKELLIVPAAGHGGAANAQPKLYWDTVKGFLSRYLTV